MTSPIKIAVTSTSFSQSATLLTELEAVGHSVRANTRAEKLTGARLAEFIGNAQIAIIGTEPITEEILASCKSLKFIAKYGVGTDNLYEPAMHKYGVKLGWTGGVNKRSVAELVLGFLLGHFRNIAPTSHALRQGKWLKVGGRQLSGCTVGIVGFGHTGSEVARLLRSLGLPASQVLYHDIKDRILDAAEIGTTLSTFENMLLRADAISFHVPLDDTTRAMYGPEQIARTRSGALIINTARGEVVDFRETCKAVQRGHLGGFAADVYASEPFDGSDFRDEPNLYFTPHIGGNSAEAVLAMGRSAISHVRDYLHKVDSNSATT